MTDVTASSLADALRDRYRLERELGQGGMATVCLAEDVRHHRKVAIKVLRPELAATMGSERFLREIEIAAQLQHPHILPLLDSGEAAGFLFYVMPYVEGESLRDRLVRQHELPVHDALRIVTEVADALAHAHSRGVVHRDIKPENILLAGRHALVADFGVAKAVSEATGRHTLTSVGVALGTPTYMAPEQAAADPKLDHRVDIYALGVVAYELLAGRPPFTGHTAQEVLAGHMTRPPEPLRAARGSVPPAVEAIVLRCLEKRPSDRWQTTGELLGQLEPLATPSGGMTPTATRPMAGLTAVKRHWLGRVAVVAALVAVGAVAWWNQTRPPATIQFGRRTQVTLSEGIEELPVPTADGKSVAYAIRPPGAVTPAVELRRVEGGKPVRLADDARPLGWSPQGDQLLVTTDRGLEIIPALGGTGRLVQAGARHGGWSPDGRSLVYTSADSVIVRTLESGATRLVTRALDPHSPVWSPDGKWIAFVSGNGLYRDTWNVAPSGIWLAPSGAGVARLVVPAHSMNLSPSWAPDSRRILFVSDRDRGRDVYQLNVSTDGRPTGEPIRLTTGLDASSISLSGDGTHLAYSVVKNRANIWSVSPPVQGWVSSRTAHAVTSGDQNIENFDVSLDGRWLVFDSNRRGVHQLFRMPVAGGDVEQVTEDTVPAFAPSLSPDGREVTYHTVSPAGLRRVFSKLIEGGKPVQVSPGASPNELGAAWSLDGRRIAWAALDRLGGTFPHIRFAERTRDGSWGPQTSLPHEVAGIAWVVGGGAVGADTLGHMIRIPVIGGPIETLAAIPDSLWRFRVSGAWDPSGRVLYQVSRIGSRIAAYAMTTSGAVREVLRFDDPRHPARPQFTYVLARAGRLFFTLGDQESDIWVAEVGGAAR